ncbi:MAG: RNA polymerase sigma-70 factor [Bacteroidia bacterium]
MSDRSGGDALERWVEGLRRGDTRAFEAIFHHSYVALGRYAMRYLSDPEDARDLVQTVMLRVWEKRAELPRPLDLSAYLHAAVRNACLNQLARQRVRLAHQHQTQTQTQAPDMTPQDDLEAHELAGRLHVALARLPGRCREAFLLSRHDGLSYREVAARMGISVKTVEAQIGKALRLLHTYLGDFLVLLGLWWLARGHVQVEGVLFSILF